MAPPFSTRGDLALPEYVDRLIAENKVMIFSKSYCPFCVQVKDLFKSLNETYFALELDKMAEVSNDGRVDAEEVQRILAEKTKQRTVPNVFVNQRHVGGCDATMAAHASGNLAEWLRGAGYDFDLAVIGGGSGGMAASKEANRLGQKVVVFDFVKPTPHNVTWGLGGTCVNVGCIPKKLMHRASILGEDMKDAPYFGWKVPQEGAQHDWQKMVEEIQAYIKSLNFGYRTQLMQKNIKYVNGYAEFKDEHTLKVTTKQGKESTVTARNFMIAVGGRPNYPNIPGAREYCLTSDDLFSLPHHPGKTLLVGASYIALECAGFLAGIGVDCTVMVRSILLRGFDQQMAEMIGNHMEKHGVHFLRSYVPTGVEQVAPRTSEAPGLLKVTAKHSSGEILLGEYNTVIFCVGRQACTESLGLEKIGVKVNPNNKKIIAGDDEQTSVPHVYAIGDVLDGKPELTPVAIQAGKLWAQRIFGGKTTLTDYVNIPTTVFTPLEYGCVGLSEEDAIAKYGEEDIEVYHTHFQPLEYELSKRDLNMCYGKLVCVKSQKEKVVGFHVLSPNAGEITQGYAIGIRMGATKEDFGALIGIHPTTAEWFTVMDVTKASGVSVEKASC